MPDDNDSAFETFTETQSGLIGTNTPAYDAALMLCHRQQLQTIGINYGHPLVIGRATSCDVALDDNGLSREHVRFTLNASGEVWVEDLDSKNGTEVNGERLVEPRRLTFRDQVTVPGASVRLYAEIPHVVLDELQEIEVARDIQRALVGPPDPISLPGFDLVGCYHPVAQCSGDLWSHYALDDDRSLIVVGDATSHGVAAAMITATVKGCCDALLAGRPSASQLSLASMLEMFNHVVCQAGHGVHQMTLAIGELDTRRSTLRWASAGHPPVLLARAVDDVYQVTPLVHGPTHLLGFIGVLRETDFAEHVEPLQSGDVLVWYTDGVIENARDDARRGERELENALVAAGAGDVASIRDAIVGATERLMGDVPREDDYAFVVAKCR